MSLNAVQQYVKSQLDDLEFPTTFAFPVGNAIARIQPFQLDFSIQPLIFIWGSTLPERRLTLGRPYGFKKVMHRIEINVHYAQEIDDPDADSKFPVILETVQAALRTVPLPVTLTDNITGQVSQVDSIGDTFDTRYPWVHSLEDQRMLAYATQIIATVEEMFLG